MASLSPQSDSVPPAPLPSLLARIFDKLPSAYSMALIGAMFCFASLLLGFAELQAAPGISTSPPSSAGAVIALMVVSGVGIAANLLTALVLRKPGAHCRPSQAAHMARLLRWARLWHGAFLLIVALYLMMLAGLFGDLGHGDIFDGSRQSLGRLGTVTRMIGIWTPCVANTVAAFACCRAHAASSPRPASTSP